MAFSVQILLCLFLDWSGDQLASRLNWPIWLDSVGTVLAAYLTGPWCGAVIGATYNLLAYILYGVPWYYAIISIIIAVFTGFAAKRKFLDTLLGTLTAGAMLSLITAAGSYPINLILNHGDTGNNWGNAVVGYLGEAGFPVWIGLGIGELYMELLDKLLVLILLFLLVRTVRIIRLMRKIKGGRGKHGSGSGLLRCIVLLLAAGLCFAGTGFSAVPVRAEEVLQSGDINYNDYVQTIYSSTNGLPCGEANEAGSTKQQRYIHQSSAASLWWFC